MKMYVVSFINVPFGSGKDEQRLASIEFRYNLVAGQYTVEYWFQPDDYEIWLQLFHYHIGELHQYTLYNFTEQVVPAPQLTPNALNYFRIMTSEDTLHEYIDYIPFLEKNCWNNMNESVQLNTASRRYL